MSLSLPTRTPATHRYHPLLFVVVLLPCLGGCTVAAQTQARGPAPGVHTRVVSHGEARVAVIDVDLQVRGVRVEVAASDVRVRAGVVSGRARTLEEWLRATGAVAGVNGGFFGKTIGDDFKEIVGLLKDAGRVRAAAPAYPSRRTGGRYAHAGLGWTREGMPRITWVTSRPGWPSELRSHPQPDLRGSGRPWRIHEGLSCGPRLIRSGKIAVSARGERLVSPGVLPRTFAGYDEERGQPHRLVLCATDGMEYEDCARFLVNYFRGEHQSICRDALCLDGGASTQAAWRSGTRIETRPGYAASVPTAILVFGN